MWLAPDAAADVRELTEAMTVRSYEQQLPVDGQVRGVWPEVSAETRLAERIAGALPDAKLQTIPAAGHLPSLERPDELNRLLLDFLQ